jgi:hypothetical protein
VNIDQRLNIQPHQVRFIAQGLLETFSYESLADIHLCLKRGAMGMYGEIYRIDAAVITVWMQSYLDEKYDALEQRKAKEKHLDKQEPRTKEAVDGSKYLQQILENIGHVPEPEKDNRKENGYQRYKLEDVSSLNADHYRKILKQEFPDATPEEIEKGVQEIINAKTRK